MRTALLSLLICSVITGIATVGKCPGVILTAIERCMDLILLDCVEIANYADFHNKSNSCRSVLQHSLQCKSTPECSCGVYSFFEVKSLQEALLSKQDTATTLPVQSHFFGPTLTVHHNSIVHLLLYGAVVSILMLWYLQFTCQ